MEALTLEWFKTLAAQGTGWILFCIACYVVYKAWGELKGKDKEICKVREDCDRDIKVVYEARLSDANRLLDKVNTVVGSNTSTLADNSRVVESRAEAIMAMKDVLSKLVIMQESDSSARRSQADRIEAAIARLMDIVHPGPKIH